jgi:hypothetical protein
MHAAPPGTIKTVLIIILDVFVIWALAVHGREMTEV